MIKRGRGRPRASGRSRGRGECSSDDDGEEVLPLQVKEEPSSPAPPPKEPKAPDFEFFVILMENSWDRLKFPNKFADSMVGERRSFV